MYLSMGDRQQKAAVYTENVTTVNVKAQNVALQALHPRRVQGQGVEKRNPMLKPNPGFQIPDP